MGSEAASSSGPGAKDSKQPIEDKTILMQVQNSLQKTFAKDTPPGERVWVWSYESHDQDPQLFKAHVEVPAWSQSFHGDWRRGKKLAQRSACQVVKNILDQTDETCCVPTCVKK